MITNVETYDIDAIEALTDEEKDAYLFEELRKPENVNNEFIITLREAQFSDQKVIDGTSDILGGSSVPSRQNVKTPFALCAEIIKKLEEVMGVPIREWKDLSILVLNAEFIEILYRNDVLLFNQVMFISDNKNKVNLAEKLYSNKGDDIFLYDAGNKLLFENKEMAKEMKKKFDIVLMNPPYQTCNEGDKKTKAIWGGFVKKAFEVCKDDGYVCAIHPSGWRDVDGNFKDSQELIKSKDIKYLEMHDEKDGVKTFGATTTYDWYVAKNCKNSGNTELFDQNKQTSNVDISNMEFIPNGMIKEIADLIAKDGEEKVKIIRDASECHTQKDWMCEGCDDIFKYKCVYTTLKDETINFWYSKKTFSYVNTPKVFWSNGAASSVHCDKTGEYGLTQFAYGIADSPENLENIKKAMESEKFIEIMKVASLGKSHKYSYKVIAQFRKDFWKEFI